eukprot:NODE_3476_length_961_cov_12.577938_g3326_i0.p1 GENE.NODE_3476_length_961_cov_12.577938_g3326_i0~~NODE_3476_length_961_cov_12.577938_g3326_i0.p1  ORF type:complete len:294 (+),score=70.33 NODE_3476_length_961_cov_12.577938_g3326_i0:62-883(+)
MAHPQASQFRLVALQSFKRLPPARAAWTKLFGPLPVALGEQARLDYWDRRRPIVKAPNLFKPPVVEDFRSDLLYAPTVQMNYSILEQFTELYKAHHDIEGCSSEFTHLTPPDEILEHFLTCPHRDQFDLEPLVEAIKTFQSGRAFKTLDRLVPEEGPEKTFPVLHSLSETEMAIFQLLAKEMDYEMEFINASNLGTETETDAEAEAETETRTKTQWPNEGPKPSARFRSISAQKSLWANVMFFCGVMSLLNLYLYSNRPQRKPRNVAQRSASS